MSLFSHSEKARIIKVEVDHASIGQYKCFSITHADENEVFAPTRFWKLEHIRCLESHVKKGIPFGNYFNPLETNRWELIMPFGYPKVDIARVKFRRSDLTLKPEDVTMKQGNALILPPNYVFSLTPLLPMTISILSNYERRSGDRREMILL